MKRILAIDWSHIYDHCKEAIISKSPEYTKTHTHNAALNRVATFLAKEIYLQGKGGTKCKSQEQK